MHPGAVRKVRYDIIWGDVNNCQPAKLESDCNVRYALLLMPSLLTNCRTALRDLVFPRRCEVCDGELEATDDHARALCSTCSAKLTIARFPACPRCAATVPSVNENTVDCTQCRRRPVRFDAAIRLGLYRDLLRTCVLRMKQSRAEPLAAALGDLLWERESADITALAAEVIVPVPMHWRRRVLRGTNSPETVADRLGRRLKVPVAPRLLVRQRNTQPQGPLSRTARKANVRGAFRLRRGFAVEDARVMLVDDVLTSGATSNECARTLKRAGAAHVSLVVLGRAEGLDGSI